MQTALLYTGAILPIFWGFAHLLPTQSVVRSFGDISEDNKRILMMEWILEGVSLIGVGIIIAVVAATDPTSEIARIVFMYGFILLNVFSVVSLFTGFRVHFTPYRLCPIIFTGSSVLILLGGIV